MTKTDTFFEGLFGDLVVDHAILPQPVGYRILLLPVIPKEKTKGGILLTDTVKDAEKYSNSIAKVISVGPIAYADRKTGEPWKGGPWCRVGDYITCGKYAGQAHNVSGVQYITINDDEVVSVLPDPTVLTSYV